MSYLVHLPGESSGESLHLHELASNLNEMQKRKLLFVAAQNEITRARINWADAQIEFIAATSRRDPTEKIQALTEYQAKLVEHVQTS